MIKQRSIVPGAAKVSGWTWVGIAAALLIYLAAAMFAAITLPWRGSLDSLSHLDYVYQVHHGRTPEPFGVQYRKITPHQPERPDRPKQHHLTASHPPLFYFIASFPMGRLLDQGKWEQAVWRGRLLNIGIGLLCVITLAWAGWRLGGRYRARLAVALPAIAGTSATFIRLTGDIYNDLLVTLFSMLAMTLSCLLLKEGYKRNYLVALALICALGMASKATFVFALLIALGTTFLTAFRDHGGALPWRFLRSAGVTSALAIAAVLPSFWFYLGNYRWSGSWFLASPEVPVQNRVEYTVWDVIASEKYWLLVPEGLLGYQWDSGWNNQQWSLWLFAACALALLGLVVFRGYWRSLLRLDRAALPSLVLAAHFAGLMFAQFHHKVGWGALNFRYSIPALLSIGLFLALPAVAWRRLSGVLVAGICGLMTLAGPLGTMSYLNSRYSQIAPGASPWQRLLATVEGNGLPVSWVWIAIVIMPVCLLALAVTVPRARAVETALDAPS